MDTRDTRPFGQLLRSYRLAAGLSQERLAERAGLSARGISDLERGARTNPRLETVRMLAEGLELPADDRSALFRAAQPALEAEGLRSPDIPPETTIARLPIPPTPLVGREHDLQNLVGLLAAEDPRLITLTGPGGVGKTRLAQEVARRMDEHFADGACYVTLVAVPGAGLVLPTIANALGIQETQSEPLRATLERFLSDRHLLLVLDNFEHVLDASPSISSLLSASAGLKVLATSRMPLQLRGERLVDLAPLEVPDLQRSMSRARLDEYGAIQLLLARIQDVKPHFALDGDNAAAIVEICRRLDGLPLALELAAVRIKLLTPQALLQRLERRLPLLTGGPRDLPERQQTMRATIAWGYDLLSPQEQVLFRRLGLFLGGWTLEAAEAVAPEESPLDIVEGLASLVDASLVQVSRGPDGDPRYLMLETVREFAMDELGASGEAEAIGRRHALYYLAMAEAAEGELSDATRRRWDAQMETDQGNIRAALVWMRDNGMAREGVRLVTVLGWFWSSHSAKAEGQNWMATFIGPAMASELPPRERIAALRWVGVFAGPEDDRTAVVARLRESLALARSEGDAYSIYSALNAIGMTLLYGGHVSESVPNFVESIALARAACDQKWTASSLAQLAYAIGILGDVQTAESLAAEALVLAQSYDAPQGVEATVAILTQGWLAFVEEDNNQAARQFRMGLAFAKNNRVKTLQGEALNGLGEVMLSRGQIDEAAALFREGLIMGWESDFPLCLVGNLQAIARLAIHRGELVRAARLVGGVDRFGDVLHALPPTMIRRYEADVLHLRQALGEDKLAIERKLGQSLGTADIVAEALVDNEESLDSPDGQTAE